MIENVYKYFFSFGSKMSLLYRHFMKVNILLKREATLPFFLHSFIFLSCFPRPIRWSSASVCRIYEWTGWFPYFIYFPYEEALVGCWVEHPTMAVVRNTLLYGCYHWYHFLFLYFSIKALVSEAKFSACSRIISDRSPSSPSFSPLSMKFYKKMIINKYDIKYTVHFYLQTLNFQIIKFCSWEILGESLIKLFIYYTLTLLVICN